MKTITGFTSRLGLYRFESFPRRVGLLLCLASVGLLCSAAITTQVATPELVPVYQVNKPAYVGMYDDTPGAIIFYTKKPNSTTCITPTHNGANPIPPTKTYVNGGPPTVAIGGTASFMAVAYKAQFTDSAFSPCVFVDNTSP